MGGKLEEKARHIAYQAHYNQYRDDGVTPYIVHPQAVSEAVTTDMEKAIAWLHDVIEDTSLKSGDLLGAGVSPQIVSCVLLLSKVKGEDYLPYLLRIKKNPIVKRIKIADIKDNLKTSTGNRRIKYQLALFILENKIRRK